MHDLKFALRMLRKNLAFTAVAVIAAAVAGCYFPARANGGMSFLWGRLLTCGGMPSRLAGGTRYPQEAD